MGAGGGKWQRLRLLREGRHPKDKNWLGAPLPEANWSIAAVSSVNIALTEVRNKVAVVAPKTAASPSNTSSASLRFELLKQRVRDKELAEGGRLVVNEKVVKASSLSECTGSSSSSKLSRFETLRQRIKMKEMSAKGELHLPE